MRDEQAPVRILVVDDQQLVRDGIISLLRIMEDLEVVGAARDGQEAITQTMTLQPDVVLMDIRMPGMDGVEATRQILQQQPSCCILMLTTFEDDEYVRNALRVGARGYLLKDMPVADLAKAIFAAAKGIYQLDASIIERFISPSNQQPSVQTTQPTLPPQESTGSGSSQQPGLTNREREILRLIATGATNREVARQLIISEGTVKNHLAHLFSRLGLRDRTQAVIYAREHNLI
ncbi:DNA-binding response regulator [Dictyobacter vulcani]|uniref:DNA-binding response regulator n=1 Tax=Dictyobacter vulcani TaxID=2607529 RepID=A0A5J4KMU3_9CHLR|nr:response regulator transcription factor [Dictyobacter vulcani]GER87611.1 DNA-binding response regulator [Dictyobacter vulcani]